MFGNVAADALAGREMHSKAGRGINLDNAAAIIDQGVREFGAITSTPATSSPIILAILSKRKTFSG